MVETSQGQTGEYNPIGEHELMKQKAQELGLSKAETKKFLLGHVSYVMHGDDANAFVNIINNPTGFTPQAGSHAKEWLIKRLKWEESTKLLPKDLDRRLKHLIPDLEKLDWSIEQNFLNAREEWYINVYDYFKSRADNEKFAVTDAKNYYLHIVYNFPYKSKK